MPDLHDNTYVKAVVEKANDDTRSLSHEELLARIVERAFGGDRARWDAFVQVVRDAIPPGVSVVLRGSSVTGYRWEDGHPFDHDGPGTSDLDLTFVGGEMLAHYRAFHIPALHSEPLSDDNAEVAPELVPLRRELCRIAGRPVNIQATTSLVQYARDVLFDQPYFTVVDGSDGSEAADGPS